MIPGLLILPLLMVAFRYESPAQGLPSNAKADWVVVLKQKRSLHLMSHSKILKIYNISLGSEPIGPKRQEGDHKTPEGGYVLDRRNVKSKFYKSIHISYPSPQDAANAQKLGVPPGGDIFLHGLPNGFGWLGTNHLQRDWTDGCIAVTDAEMDEIWRAVPDGTPIDIRP
jgi:murein L,D-transpeptidase YafK